MNLYDYLAIGFYLVFMLSMGPVFMRFSKTASDYFRGGGGMLWWVVGSSVFMSSFSAWSFTGGAGRAYQVGTYFFVLFLANFISLWFTYFKTAARFRQMRVITAIEGVRKRYGNTNEQVFAWMPLPFNLVMGGLALYVISVFMEAVFGFNFVLLIIVLAVLMTSIALLGGAWAAAASDFVQMTMLTGITLVMVTMTLIHPQIGGISGLIEKLPRHHFDWTMIERPWIIVAFVSTLIINQLIQNNSMMLGASKFILVKNGIDAKRATLVTIFGFLIMTPVWIIPAMGATILHPNLMAEFPRMGADKAVNAAYVAMALQMLPHGLLGVLISAIFAASVGYMTYLLSLASGIFVRNFYIRIIDKTASEERQIKVGRIFTAFYGLSWILVALFFKKEQIPLFNALLLVAASVQIPTTVPQFFGLFVKRTPKWSAWSTMAVGFLFSILMWPMFQDANFFNRLFSPAKPFTPMEAADLRVAVTTAVLFVVCISWYFMTMLFYRENDKAYVKQVDDFFKEIDTPIDTEKEHGKGSGKESQQYRVLGYQSLIYGGFIYLLLLIPNNLTARLATFACGSLLTGVGGLLYLVGRMRDAREAKREPELEPVA